MTFSVVRLCAVGLLFALAGVSFAEAPDGGKLWVFVGTYTGGKSKGVYRCELDTAAGKLTKPELAGEVTSPSFLAIHPGHRFLFAVNEVPRSGGRPGGAVTAFAIDPKSGDLKLLNRQPSGGAGPCYIVTDREGKHVLVANYGGGSVSVLPVGKDGRLGEATAFRQHRGKGTNPQRQEAPHAHSINLDRANRFAFACDLGLDKVLVYRCDTAKGTLAPNDPPAFDLAPGSGPRHFDFHPSGKYAYVINEMANTITAASYDADKGILTKLQTISTLPKEFKGENTTADIHVHPSGKFLYGSNRGHNSIAVFSIDSDTGKLTHVANQPTRGKTPRNFGLDPSGKFLLAANQDSDSLVLFRIDPQTGELHPTGQSVTVPKPVCVKMMPAGR